MTKQKMVPFINITPIPLPKSDTGVYTVAEPLTDVERKQLALAWEKLNRESGGKRMLIVLPKGTNLEELHTEHLKNLQKGINEALRGRG